MKRREIFLFLSFAILFVLFAFFQNFSFPAKQLEKITQKDFYQRTLHKFVPTYSFNDSIGNIETPYGYKEEVTRKIASQDEPIVFDQKKFLKDGIKTLPLYKDIKDVIDVSSSPAEGAPCVEDPAAAKNNCFTEYAGERQKSNSAGPIKVRANPFRQTASISVPGQIESSMVYDGDRNSVNVQFKKDIHKDAGLKLELDSVEKSGSVNIDLRW